MDFSALAERLLPGEYPALETFEKRYPPRDLPKNAEVTRLAPSPTGFIHLGNLFVAIANERIAHRSGGTLYLRIEDTDLKRKVEGAVEAVISALDYFDINFDEGAEIGGDDTYAPWYQRQRADIYRAYVKDLIRRGRAYPCFCTEEELSALRARQAAGQQEKQTLNAELEGVLGQTRTLNDRIEQLSEERHKQEIELTKIDSDLENLQARIDEEYQETYESCLQYKSDEFDPKEGQTAVNRLKREIGSLGAINHNALEEYETLNAQYQEMTAQRDDVQKGIDDTTAALEELKGEMQKQFDEGFDRINENFKKLFKELFGGGRAELQMDYSECDDALSAGVEIVACPPGKKLTKISLLSGGERALTAIAILFAILMLRPMPFCVLDEIEAALDEANVDKFAQFLKKFAKETQFIVITHRKPTMEKADSLFGVTMEEKGVSKIVSVKLSEVESRLGGDTVN